MIHLTNSKVIYLKIEIQVVNSPQATLADLKALVASSQPSVRVNLHLLKEHVSWGLSIATDALWS